MTRRFNQSKNQVKERERDDLRLQFFHYTYGNTYKRRRPWINTTVVYISEDDDEYYSLNRDKEEKETMIYEEKIVQA